VHSWLLAVEIDIPDEAITVHGITSAFAKENGEPPAQALDIIAHDLARAMLARIPVVGCNLTYDLTLLDRELRRHDLPTVDERLGRPIAPVLDALVLDKHIDPYRPGGRKLTDLCETYNVVIAGAHDSTFDALAAARVVYRIGLLTQCGDEYLMKWYAARKRPTEIVERLRSIAAMSLFELHDAQVGWRREQCDGLRRYFNRKGTKHDGVPGDWPQLPYLHTDEKAIVDGR